MASAFKDCCQTLKDYGVEGESACRACEIAFWDAFGMTPDSADRYGVDPGGDISGRALGAVAELAGQVPDGQFFGPESEMVGTLESASLEAYGLEVESQEVKSLFREVRMLAPGDFIDAKGKTFKVTDADLRQYAANFDPSANPPILLDHEAKASNIQGWIRALRYVPGFDETSSELVALWEFLGEEACEKVEQGLYKRVSGLFGRLEPKKVYEGSVVVFGAYDRGRGDRAEILKKKGATMSKPTETAPASQGQAQDAPATAPVASPAPIPQTAPLQEASEVSALRGQLEAFQVKLAAMRKREDEQDFRLLMADGFATPANEQAEVAFLGLLSDEQKTAYLGLRRKQPKAWEPGRQSVPADPQKPGESPQDAVFSQLMQVAGMSAPETK